MFASPVAQASSHRRQLAGGQASGGKRPLRGCRPLLWFLLLLLLLASLQTLRLASARSHCAPRHVVEASDSRALAGFGARASILAQRHICMPSAPDIMFQGGCRSGISNDRRARACADGRVAEEIRLGRVGRDPLALTDWVGSQSLSCLVVSVVCCARSLKRRHHTDTHTQTHFP